MVSKRADLPTFLAAELGAWAKDFSAWAKEKPAGLEKATETQLVAAAKKNPIG